MTEELCICQGQVTSAASKVEGVLYLDGTDRFCTDLGLYKRLFYLSALAVSVSLN